LPIKEGGEGQWMGRSLRSRDSRQFPFVGFRFQGQFAAATLGWHYKPVSSELVLGEIVFSSRNPTS